MRKGKRDNRLSELPDRLPNKPTAYDKAEILMVALNGKEPSGNEFVLANLKQGKEPEEFAGYLGLTAAEVRDIAQKALAPA